MHGILASLISADAAVVVVAAAVAKLRYLYIPMTQSPDKRLCGSRKGRDEEMCTRMCRCSQLFWFYN